MVQGRERNEHSWCSPKLPCITAYISVQSIYIYVFLCLSVRLSVCLSVCLSLSLSLSLCPPPPSLPIHQPSRQLHSSVDTRVLHIPCLGTKSCGQRSFSYRVNNNNNSYIYIIALYHVTVFELAAAYIINNNKIMTIRKKRGIFFFFFF